jgi:hypothetical protein
LAVSVICCFDAFIDSEIRPTNIAAAGKRTEVFIIVTIVRGYNNCPLCIVFTLMPLCLDFYVLDLHVYSIHECHQIPYDKPDRLGDDADVHPRLLIP